MGGLISYLCRNYVLWRFGRDIRLACSEQNWEELVKLMKENGIISMQDEVETQLLTRTTLQKCLCGPSSSEDPIKGGLDCISLVMAVLLTRKLLKENIIDADDFAVHRIWTRPIYNTLADLLMRIPEKDALNCGIGRSAPDFCYKSLQNVHSTLSAAEVLDLQCVFRRPWMSYPPERPLMCSNAYVVLATFSSDPETLRSIFSAWNPNYSVKYLSQMLPYLLNLAQTFGVTDLENSVLVFKELHHRSSMSVHEFLHTLMKVTCKRYIYAPRELELHSLPTLDLICTRASFFFDSSVVCTWKPQKWTVLQLALASNMIALLHMESLHRGIRLLCLKAFADLSQRGGAAAFLLALQNKDALQAVPSSHRKNLIMYLMQCVRVTRNLYPVPSSCDLCQEPTASLLLWMLNQSSPVECLPDPEEVFSYCQDTCLLIFRQLQRFRFRSDGCVHATYGYSFIDRIVRQCESYTRSTNLRQCAILTVLENLGGDCGNLKTVVRPEGLAKYFFLDHVDTLTKEVEPVVLEDMQKGFSLSTQLVKREFIGRLRFRDIFDYIIGRRNTIRSPEKGYRCCDHI